MTSQAFFSKHRNTTLPVGALLDGNLVQTVTGKSVTLTPAISDLSWLQKKFQQNIQRAADTVIVRYGEQGKEKEYALVADYNFAFNDPHWGNSDIVGKQIGGKLGIIEDPFGKNGEPTFLGATTPIVGGAVEHLSLSADGKKLYADVLVDEQTGPGTWRVYKPLFVWDAAALIQAALDAKVRGQTLTTPIDRIKGITGAAGQITAAIPQRYNGAQAGEYFGWTYGIGTYTDTTVNVAATGNYGDVIGVDLIKLIAQQQLGLAPLTVKADGTTNWTIAQQQEYSALLDLLGKNLSDFNIGQDQIDPLKLDPTLPADHNKQPRMQLVLKQDGTLYSRNDAEGNLPADFKTSGVFFLAPTINGDDETALRAGKTIAAKAPVTLSFSYKEQGVEKQGIVSVTAHDYASRSNTFFGDRPLDNPGYSAFTLHGEVGVGKANDPLDVYRVEQRLRYLGFPAMGYGDPLNTAAQNKLQEFDVDGQWGSKESYASRFFYKVVSYGVNGRQLVPAGHGDNFVHADYFAALQAATASFSVNGKTMEYLNAYNAPHWMDIGTQMQYQGYTSTVSQSSATINGWRNTQAGTSPNTSIEKYGTSWMRDLIVASQYAPDALRGTPVVDANGNTTYTPRNNFWLNGAVDANHGFTPDGHGSHDLGMAFDLGVSGNISNAKKGSQNDANDVVNTQVAQDIAKLTAGTWSVAKAVSNSELLPHDTDIANLNDQVSAIKDFLSLYAVTQNDGSANALTHVVNGSTTLFSGMIANVIIGGTGSQNPYDNIRTVLSSVGINPDPQVINHNSHFHIYLKPPTQVEITATKHLLTETTTTATSTPITQQADAQGLLDYTQNLITGEELMFTMDVPYVPAQQTPIVLAQAATSATSQPSYILKDCQEVLDLSSSIAVFNGISPEGMLRNYIGNRDHRPIQLASIKNITLLEGTKHGKITSDGLYIPERGYLGNDKAIFMAEFEGKRYKIILDIHVVTYIDPGTDNPTTTCPPPKLIKVTKPSSGLNGYDLNGVSVTFADLPAGALGQTTGSSITLDTNAAGNGWYIDLTPSDNSEYLPTSNPNEWVAKAGSAAAGKMDMLTVLLHEYGHALGIDHNPDAHDYMGTTLTAGVRRLPTPDELALMGQLVAQAKSGLASSNTQDNVPNPFPTLPLGGMSLAFAGLLQRNRYGGLNAILNNSTMTQYDVAANVTLTNGNLSSGNGWATQGSVNIGNGVAALSEVSTTQTRLNQVFMVNTHDRYLSFTLSGAALDDLNGAPDDAFEVALLDANSGASLLGSNGLTHSDAFLNLQADGTEHLAQGVTRITNPDGSRTYRVDLSGVASGTAVNLSFDLIGFGQNNSHVNISDVRLSGLPQLHDDAVTLLEDGTSAKSLVIAGLSQRNRYGGLNVML